jgi:threonine dehydratase
MTTLFTLDELDRAGELVHAHVPPTPQFAWPLLAAELGTPVVVKHENHTPVGAFKVRGGLVHVDRLRRERPDVRGIISATRGNHGQSLAFAGRVHDMPVVIVVPRGNSVEKNAAMRALGAELIEHGHDFQAAREHARQVALERGLEMVDSFHRDLVLGVATYAHELFGAEPDLDVVYVPLGLGSGVCGLITVRDLLGLCTEIVGVVAEAAPTYLHSVAAGRPVPSERADTFADGVACRVPVEHAISIIVAGRARVIAVDDDATAEAIRVLHRTTHNTAEPAGAIALAGAMAERDALAGRRVGVILTGGNVDADVHAAVLSGITPRP